MKDIPNLNIPNLQDLASKGFVKKYHTNCQSKITSIFQLSTFSNTTETSTSSVVIKSVITTISNEKTNGENETLKTTTTTHEESQF